VHNGVRVASGDTEGRKKLAQYMLRAPFSLEKMTYLPETGMVMYRSHMHKSLKRNFQLMPGAQWLELLCRHIPDRFEHLVRYVGWYSTRVRARRQVLQTSRPDRFAYPSAPLDAEAACVARSGQCGTIQPRDSSQHDEAGQEAAGGAGVRWREALTLGSSARLGESYTLPEFSLYFGVRPQVRRGHSLQQSIPGFRAMLRPIGAEYLWRYGTGRAALILGSGHNRKGDDTIFFS